MENIGIYLVRKINSHTLHDPKFGAKRKNESKRHPNVTKNNVRNLSVCFMTTPAVKMMKKKNPLTRYANENTGNSNQLDRTVENNSFNGLFNLDSDQTKFAVSTKKFESPEPFMLP